jgi:PKD repeat protein
LKIWRGTSASGTLEEATTVHESAGAWSAVAPEALPDGTYTAQAEQLPEAHDAAGVSGTSTFVVDTVAPSLTLLAPPTSTGLESVTGTAGAQPGDRQAVTLELFSGSSVGESGHAFEALTVNRVGSSWSGAFANLPGGEYAVIAKQSDEAGNVGASNPSTFTVTTPPPPPPAPPSASFTWVPATPTAGQSVSLVSSSTDLSSAIDSFAWDVAGDGQFAPGGPAMTTSFAHPGLHAVSLRVSDGNGLSSTATETIRVAAAVARLMQPFPIVRIVGSETSSGATVRLLSVQAPVGARVSITCVGGGCKAKTESRVAKASSKSPSRAGAITLAFSRFERPLRPGAILQIRVTRSGEIGKFTSFAIRRNRLPARTDACLPPASSKPSACPAS